MARGSVGEAVIVVRERRMWTQVRLAEEAGVSPTTVSGIESGRISRPHFGTLRKLARALGVEPEELVWRPGVREDGVPSSLSLQWAMSSGEEEFERALDGASIEGLSSLSRELDGEEVRLRRLYGEAQGAEQRRLVKNMIRRVAANSGSVEASISAHRNGRPAEHRPPGGENPSTRRPPA